MKDPIEVSTTVKAPLNKVWEYWTSPQHITKWNFASDDWHCPNAENDLQIGAKFSYRMESTDGEMGFNFSGKYTEISPNNSITYLIDDGRKVSITFNEEGDSTKIVEQFEAENENARDMQQQGWQAILNNFKRYAEQEG
ncbi:SRPBCC family protein [Marivirga atlantica]|uniref:SRPBCC family protein n=1 Tax=Marivirga atlantica TaxID=1548457 RepID=A0A937DI98_9BACT|nr:SRPBCC family protein [Marivirga atlantica]MBL0763941.1 SRPBCC family protein [Marivirga atlantica]